MTITPDQERALLALYEAVKLCDESFDWHEDGRGPNSSTLLMWHALDLVYAAFGYAPRTTRPVVTTEDIDHAIAEEKAAASGKELGKRAKS
jgi:hypothetical protein